MEYARIVIGDAPGAPEDYRLEKNDPGLPAPDEVRIKVHAAGVSHVDVLIAAGKYQTAPTYPFTPGLECAGIVESVGERVSGLQTGDRVLVSGSKGHAYSDIRLADARHVYLIPDSMSFETASVFRLNYTTAWHALKQRGALKPGETILILGAAGGIGYAAMEIALAMQARVIALVSNSVKRDMLEAAGAHHVLNSHASDLKRQVKALTPYGVDMVVDPVGGHLTETAFRTLGYGGRHLMIGFASGAIPHLPANLPLLKTASLIGVDVHTYIKRDKRGADLTLQSLFRLYETGFVNPPIERIYPIEAFADAMRHAAGGKALGRIVLRMR